MCVCRHKYFMYVTHSLNRQLSINKSWRVLTTLRMSHKGGWGGGGENQLCWWYWGLALSSPVQRCVESRNLPIVSELNTHTHTCLSQTTPKTQRWLHHHQAWLLVLCTSAASDKHHRYLANTTQKICFPNRFCTKGKPRTNMVRKTYGWLVGWIDEEKKTYIITASPLRTTRAIAAPLPSYNHINCEREISGTSVRLYGLILLYHIDLMSDWLVAGFVTVSVSLLLAAGCESTAVRSAAHGYYTSQAHITQRMHCSSQT